MNNEYLFQSDENRAKVEAYKPEEVAMEIVEIGGTPLWIARYSISGHNEDSAKKLSEVHTAVIQYEVRVMYL